MSDLINFGLFGLFLYVLFYGTWFFYIALMGIKKHRVMLKDKLGVLWYGLYPLLIIGLAMDVLFNFIIGTVYFRELPKIFDKEFLFTSRCQRHMEGDGIQLYRAHKVCTYLLDPFEEGGHC